LAVCFLVGLYDYNLLIANIEHRQVSEASGFVIKTSSEGKNQAEPRADLPQYIHWDFFGIPETENDALDIEALPETTLSLDLFATFTSNSDFSSAVIRAEGGKSKRIFVNDEISQGVTLHAVSDNKVVIYQGTTLETLTLFEFQPTMTSAGRRRRNSQSLSSVGTTAQSVVNTPVDNHQNTVIEHFNAIRKRRADYASQIIEP